MEAVGGIAERHPHQRVKDKEDVAVEQRDLRQRQPQGSAQQRHQVDDQLTINEVENIEQGQKEEQEPGGA